MKRKRLGDTQCPIARGLEQVGEWWSIMILRDALHGFTRFDEFQESLGIAPNMLTKRLTSLVESGLLERRLYNEHPPRYEYILTQQGRDFRPVLITLLSWGNKYLAPEGKALVLAEAKTGKMADPVLVDRVSGKPVTERDFVFRPGPAASARIRRRYAER
jgi:DNA-binding HxlR family transcriptional regulator